MTKTIIIEQEQEPKKKTIQFTQFLSSSEMRIVNGFILAPSDFDTIELICRNYGNKGKDLMFAYKGNNRNDSKGHCFYLGHWNDGVVA